jgi:hypothetical protein
MASQIDQGPATGNAALLFGGTPVATIEVHIPLGIDPLSPAAAPYVDPQAATNSSVLNSTNKAVQFGALGTGIQFTLPA